MSARRPRCMPCVIGGTAVLAAMGIFAALLLRWLLALALSS